ncbi:unnamed protein product, partial [Discosporangium mesarthrocarpum]
PLNPSTNPWKEVKLHKLMSRLEEISGQEAEQEFVFIGEAILSHLVSSEPPLTRALALDAAQTFVQLVLSCRSQDKRSSKVRRRAFKALLAHLVPLMLDCLREPTEYPGGGGSEGEGEAKSEGKGEGGEGQGQGQGQGVGEGEGEGDGGEGERGKGEGGE